MSATDPVLEDAMKWYRKLNNPNGATYRLAHARIRVDMATAFDPEALLAAYRATSGERMNRLAEAAKIIRRK